MANVKLKLLMAAMLFLAPLSVAFAQAGGPVAVRAPIGRTANGTLVYSMKCDNMPAPPPPPQAEAAPAPPPEPEMQRTGIFGLSYTRKPPDQ